MVEHDWEIFFPIWLWQARRLAVSERGRDMLSLLGWISPFKTIRVARLRNTWRSLLQLLGRTSTDCLEQNYLVLLQIVCFARTPRLNKWNIWQQGSEKWISWCSKGVLGLIQPSSGDIKPYVRTSHTIKLFILPVNNVHKSTEKEFDCWCWSVNISGYKVR